MADGAEIDLPAHQRAYVRFLGFAKVGVIVAAMVAAIVVLIISR